MKAGFLAAAVALSCFAQDGVVSGYVFDASQGGFRAVIGMAGAARLGESRAYDIGIATAEVRGSTAVFISEETPPRVYRVHLDSNAAPTPIPTGLQQPSHVFLNRDGAAALLYSAGENLLQFPGAPPLPASLLDGPPRAAAVSADGKCALIATAAAVQRLCDGGALTMILRAEDTSPADVAWTSNGRGALIATGVQNCLLWIEDIEAHTPPVRFATDGAVIGVAALDASTAAAITADASMLVVDLRQTETPRRIALPVRATALVPLSSPSLLAGTRAGEGPLLLLDGARGWTPFFVPLD